MNHGSLSYQGIQQAARLRQRIPNISITSAYVTRDRYIHKRRRKSAIKHLETSITKFTTNYSRTPITLTFKGNGKV